MISSSRRGIALIVVLLMVAVLVAITIQWNRSSRSEVHEAANLSDGIRLRYVAESGFYAGEALLLSDRNGFDALTEKWAKADELARQSEEFFDDGSFRLLIEDEGGRIPINRLVNGNLYNATVRDILLRLMTGPYFRLSKARAGDILDAAKDWMDADSEVTGGGAEEGYYAGLGRPYAAKNAALDCIEELLMVRGMTSELFYGTEESPGLATCLTIFGDGKININTASKPVLRALSAEMTDDGVEELDEGVSDRVARHVAQHAGERGKAGLVADEEGPVGGYRLISTPLVDERDLRARLHGGGPRGGDTVGAGKPGFSRQPLRHARPCGSPASRSPTRSWP